MTGKNGSGKSHLLEAIASKVAKIHIDNVEVTNILHIGFNGLTPQIAEHCHPSQITEHITTWCNQVTELGHLYKQALQNNQVQNLTHFLSGYGNPTINAVISKIIADTGKDLHEIKEEEIARNISFADITPNSLFSAQLAMTIKSYHYRLEKNDFAEYRASKHGGTGYNYLSREDFVEKYGPPPWDLINDILARANLPYEISPPNLADFELPYRVTLKDTNSNIEISTNDLSSGEKVLMSLALAIYRTTEEGILPELLLLDEPDAALHPQFSKLLIEILTETIVNKAGIRVIITTHSPSTVAMAPENSVFEIDKRTRTPFSVRNSDAVRTLTEGVDFLRVSFESRRQIFVESKYDVVYFDKLFGAVSRLHKFTYQPVFIEPHSGTSNCTDVISIVNRLRHAKNDLVWGIIDFDNDNKSTDSIIVLGGGSRYAIENYLLDPLYVCFCLIRNNQKKFTDFGVSTGKARYSEIPDLTQQECQIMIDSLLTQSGIALNDLLLTKLVNGFELNYPSSFLLHQGHDYEEKLKAAFPGLQAIARGKGDAVLKLGVMEAISDYPKFLPVEIFETFSKILNSKN
ncbi:AAA family ATPase [Pseudomonas helleri]|uniref:AAA family ATPase n=1 Tax=Pseudomonas helleri TaxID=1608996 RepID=UPI00389B3012